MNIDDIFGAQTSSQKPAGANKELGQADFMKLLVAQMKNQDPSSPADNSQFLSQIAQFSMVDGIDKLGTSFNGISSSFFTTQAMQASTLIGREVLTEVDYSYLQPGAGISGIVAVPESSAGLNLQVRDSKGALVRTLVAGHAHSGPLDFTWDGLDENGEEAPEGKYTVQATALVDNKQQALPVALYQRVESITVGQGAGNVRLQLANEQQVSFAEIYKYR